MKRITESLKGILKKHIYGILMACVVGIIFILPQTFARIDLGDDYKGAPFLYQNDDEKAYLTNIQEVLDGHIFVSSPAFDGYKDTKATVLPYGEYLYAFPSMIFGIPLITVVNVSKFIFPAILFFLVYLLIRNMTEEKENRGAIINAIAGGLLVTLGYEFADFGYVLSILKGTIVEAPFPVWTRLVNPITGGLFLMLFLNMFWKSLHKKGLNFPIFTGIIMILMSGYIFSLATALSAIFIFFVLSLFRKEYLHAKQAAIIFSIGIIPLIYQIYSSFTGGDPESSDIGLTKMGLIYTHLPLMNNLLILAIVLFIIISVIEFSIRDKNNKYDMTWWYFSISLLLAPLAAFTQQIVTGRTIWPHHFVQYSIPIVFIVGMITSYKFIRPRFKILWKIGTISIIAITIMFGVWTSFSYKSNMEDYGNSQRYVEVFDWINLNTEKDCVILMSEDKYKLTFKIPAYTHCNMYHTIQNYYGVPQDRIEHGYFSWLELKGITEDNIEEYLRTNLDEVRRARFTNWLQKFMDSKDPWLNRLQAKEDLSGWQEEQIKYLVREYRKFIKEDYLSNLKKYNIDYVVWDKNFYPDWNPDKFNFLEEVFNVNNIHIFQIK